MALEQGSQTRGQWAACGPRGPFVRPAILFGNFLIINITIAKCLEKTCHEIIEPKLSDTHCGLRPGRSTTDQIFTLQQIFEKSWEYTKDVYTCFVDLEKAYDRVTREKLSGVFRENGVDDRLLLAVKSLYPCSEVFVPVGRVKPQLFTVGFVLRQAGTDPGGERSPPLKPKKVTFFHHDFVEIGKKH